MHTWIDKAADKIEARADDACSALAERVREKYVIPFCDRHHLKFTSGMGGWDFDEGARDTGYYGYYGKWQPERLPTRLREALCTSIRNGRQSLGSFMRDYTAPTYLPKEK
jgi:hypothetical protein